MSEYADWASEARKKNPFFVDSFNAMVEEALKTLPEGERKIITYCASCAMSWNKFMWAGRVIPDGHDAETHPFDGHHVMYHHYDDTPAADDDTCRSCYEWRRFNNGQEHFGYAWWLICDSHGYNKCKCKHHLTELWIG